MWGFALKIHFVCSSFQSLTIFFHLKVRNPDLSMFYPIFQCFIRSFNVLSGFFLFLSLFLLAGAPLFGRSAIMSALSKRVRIRLQTWFVGITQTALEDTMRTLQALFFAGGALGIAACGTDGGETGPANVIVSAGAYHTCQIINPLAEVECWGNNGSGRATPPPGVLFSTVSTGFSHTCGLRASDNKVQCWGSNAAGRLDVPN